jgi:acetylornithine deacetylase
MNQSTAQISQLNNTHAALTTIKQHLAFLISQDTCNPPRTIQFTDPLFVKLEAFFKDTGFTVTMADFGEGHVAFYAVRGCPKVLFNVHLDTVPVSGGWQHDPFTLTEVGDRLYGRGVCDIKGAAACLMALAETTSHDMAVLFTTDEEGANNCCVQNFIDGHDLSVYQQVIVAEPTQCLAITEHRGYVSAHATFSGQSGHSSSANALTENAIHQANGWLNSALHHAQKMQTTNNPAGICFNLGYIKGGEKNNMIAEQCQLGFSIRVPAGASSQAAFDQLINNSSAEWNCSLMAPALPDSPDANQQSKYFCQQHGIEQGTAVDFWTEASLFCQAGMPALVLGSGNIAQAHTVDEWVATEQLLKCHDIYLEVLS